MFLAFFVFYFLVNSVELGTGEFEDWILEKLADRSGQNVDLRISRALGTKGYNKARVTVVTQEQTRFDYKFDVQSPFQQRWKDNYLYSSIIDLTPGKSMDFTIANQTFSFYLPPQGAATSGIIISDPCFSSKWIDCFYKNIYNTFNHSTTIINAIMEHDPNIHFWKILGDNFYDQTGELTKLYWDALTPKTRQRFFSMTIGNHDTWVCGGPQCGDEHDQFGIGMMQYYGVDPISSLHASGHFLNFTIDPDQVQKWDQPLTAATNLIWYNIIGNLGFIGWSGAYSWEELEVYFKGICAWMHSEQPDYLFLLSHWNEDSMGCQSKMSSPDVYKILQSTPGCTEFGDRLKYQDGHVHQNHVQAKGDKENVGFMIGGHGMIQGVSIGGQFGFEYIQSRPKGLRIYYFELNRGLERNRKYEKILACIEKSQGLDACVHLADKWLDTSF